MPQFNERTRVRERWNYLKMITKNDYKVRETKARQSPYQIRVCFWFIAKTNLSWYSFLLCVVVDAAVAFFSYSISISVSSSAPTVWKMTDAKRAPCNAFKKSFLLFLFHFSDTSLDYWINDVTRFWNQWTFNAIILHLILFVRYDKRRTESLEK